MPSSWARTILLTKKNRGTLIVVRIENSSQAHLQNNVLLHGFNQAMNYTCSCQYYENFRLVGWNVEISWNLPFKYMSYVKLSSTACHINKPRMFPLSALACMQVSDEPSYIQYYASPAASQCTQKSDYTAFVTQYPTLRTYRFSSVSLIGFIGKI